jgi:hypothetical protein
VLLRPSGKLTLPPCSTTDLELLVHIRCDPKDQTPDDDPRPAKKAAGARAKAAERVERGSLLEEAATQRDIGDVDQCEVGYVTVRVGGCLICPIVVAIAALPRSCDAYRAACSCGCC